jgi:hypothetical protein
VNLKRILKTKIKLGMISFLLVLVKKSSSRLCPVKMPTDCMVGGLSGSLCLIGKIQNVSVNQSMVFKGYGIIPFEF